MLKSDQKDHKNNDSKKTRQIHIFMSFRSNFTHSQAVISLQFSLKSYNYHDKHRIKLNVKNTIKKCCTMLS